ncbi:OmpA family protein [Hugenholtzia roseola]|uniref:OmpA family protein n=1 Tax=Hugenholtzia roseola TaxID=1002 RepID=UPI000413E1C8|nr:OmpA family protein [Hugenholtzia roseola]
MKNTSTWAFRLSQRLVWSWVLSFGLLPTLWGQMDLKPTATEALLNVSVVDFKKNPKPNEVIRFVNTTSKEVFAKTSNAEGKCQFLLPKGHAYSIQYKNYSKDVEYSQVAIPNARGMLKIEVLVRFQAARTYTLDNVHFATGKAELAKVSYKSLEELGNMMKTNPNLEIEIGGHTDNVGSPQANLKLSQDRAESVRQYLIKVGIQPNRIIAKGYGDTQPVSDNSTEEGRGENRRTEVRILKE